MVTTINTQALASSVSSGASSRRAERPDAEQAFKALDSGAKGYLTADDLQAAVVKISAEGARRADTAGPAAPGAQEMFAQMDGDGDGKVTQQEFKAAEPKAPPSGGAQGAKPAGGQPPASAAGAGAGTKAASSTSSSSETYEPADTNEDGKVSAQEQQAYDARLAAEKAATQAAGSARTAEADAAVKAYEAVEQLGQGSSTAAA
jgi:EF-hand domain pair/EF hand